MTELTPEEKIRLNKIFGAQAVSRAFPIENDVPGKIFDQSNSIQMAYDVLRECIEARTIDPIDAINEAIDCLEGVVKH